MAKRLRKYDFTILVKNIDDDHGRCAQRLYAVCGDAMLGRQAGYDFVDFIRKADSFEEAATSAIRDVRKARMTPMRIKLDEYVNASDIARRMKRSRQSVSQLIRGQRGPGGFPPPAHVSSGNIASYAWTDVIDWLSEHDFQAQLTPLQEETFSTTSTMNALLQLQRKVKSVAKAERLWKKISA
jgi:hypothetical protein